MKTRITSEMLKKIRRETDKGVHKYRPRRDKPTKTNGEPRVGTAKSARTKIKKGFRGALSKAASNISSGFSAVRDKFKSIRVGDKAERKDVKNQYYILAWLVNKVIYAQILPHNLTEKEQNYYANIVEDANRKSSVEIPYVLDFFDGISPKEAIKDVLLSLVDGDEDALNECVKDIGVLHIEKLDVYSD